MDKQAEDDLIDEASAESFPASDPPSWTMGKSSMTAEAEAPDITGRFAGGARIPDVEVEETKDAFLLKTNLPGGCAGEGIHFEIEDGALTVVIPKKRSAATVVPASPPASALGPKSKQKPRA